MAMNGTIRRLVAEKPFGFIRDERGQDYFFHVTSLRNCGFEELFEGALVRFNEAGSDRGPRAGEVWLRSTE